MTPRELSDAERAAMGRVVSSEVYPNARAREIDCFKAGCLAALDAREAEELPGDGQRPALVLGNGERIELTDAQAEKVRHVLVRDTEREHEPAEDEREKQARQDAREAFSANIHHPDAIAQHPTTPEEGHHQGWLAASEWVRGELEGCAREALGEPADSPCPVERLAACYRSVCSTAQEQWDQRKEAERHADVLAKALDQFFKSQPHENLVERLACLMQQTNPTLQALGYPKEETP